MYFESTDDRFESSGGSLTKRITFGTDEDFDTLEVTQCQISQITPSTAGTVVEVTGISIDYLLADLTFSYNENTLPDDCIRGTVSISIECKKFDSEELINTFTGDLYFNFTQPIGVAPVPNPIPIEIDPDTGYPKPYIPEPGEVTADDLQNQLGQGYLTDEMKDSIRRSTFIQGTGLNQTAIQLMGGFDSTVNKIHEIEGVISSLRDEVNEEMNKKSPDQSRIYQLNDKIDYNIEKLYSLMDSVGNTDHLEEFDYESKKIEIYGENGETYIEDQFNELKRSPKGTELDNQMNEFNKSFELLQQFVPDLVSSTSTAAFEPMGAVVVTPVGAGSVATNPLQITGTIKRIKGQVFSLNPILLDILNQCRVLGLQGDVVKKLTQLTEYIQKIEKFISS